MFTGLVQDLGTVGAVDRTADGARVRIATGLAGELAEGDSIAVNGVCLTATAARDGAFSAESQKTRSFLYAHAPDSIQDPYTLALVINALAAMDPRDPGLDPYLERLE